MAKQISEETKVTLDLKTIGKVLATMRDKNEEKLRKLGKKFGEE